LDCTLHKLNIKTLNLASTKIIDFYIPIDRGKKFNDFLHETSVLNLRTVCFIL